MNTNRCKENHIKEKEKENSRNVQSCHATIHKNKPH